MMNRAQREALAAAEAAREKGAAWHKDYPDAMVASAFWAAGKLYTHADQVTAFVEGFQAARHQRDEYLAEQEKA